MAPHYVNNWKHSLFGINPFKIPPSTPLFGSNGQNTQQK